MCHLSMRLYEKDNVSRQTPPAITSSPRLHRIGSVKAVARLWQRQRRQEAWTGVVPSDDALQTYYQLSHVLPMHSATPSTT
jgi:hypothetical protein